MSLTEEHHWDRKSRLPSRPRSHCVGVLFVPCQDRPPSTSSRVGLSRARSEPASLSSLFLFTVRSCRVEALQPSAGPYAPAGSTDTSKAGGRLAFECRLHLNEQLHLHQLPLAGKDCSVPWLHFVTWQCFRFVPCANSELTRSRECRGLDGRRSVRCRRPLALISFSRSLTWRWTTSLPCACFLPCIGFIYLTATVEPEEDSGRRHASAPIQIHPMPYSLLLPSRAAAALAADEHGGPARQTDEDSDGGGVHDNSEQRSEAVVEVSSGSRPFVLSVRQEEVR